MGLTVLRLTDILVVVSGSCRYCFGQTNMRTQNLRTLTIDQGGPPAAESRRVPEQIVAHILALSREYAASGRRLPSERDLAKQLGVGRSSVREALRTLSDAGLVHTRSGDGSRVKFNDTSAVLQSAFLALAARENPSLIDLYEIREIVEVFLAGRAAERRTDFDLAEIQSALAAMNFKTGDPTDLAGANMRFHNAIASAAHNPVLAEFMRCIYTCTHERIVQGGYRVADWPVSREVHDQIYDAIRRQNPQDARRAMTMHMGIAIEEIRSIERSPIEPRKDHRMPILRAETSVTPLYHRSTTLTGQHTRRQYDECIIS